MKAEQGDILKVERITQPALVVSNNLFNEEGMAIICPIQEGAIEGPLHLRIEHPKIKGLALCEQLMLVDLRARRFSKLGEVSHYDILNTADAVMSIFDYQNI